MHEESVDALRIAVDYAIASKNTGDALDDARLCGLISKLVVFGNSHPEEACGLFLRMVQAGLCVRDIPPPVGVVLSRAQWDVQRFIWRMMT